MPASDVKPSPFKFPVKIIALDAVGSILLILGAGTLLMPELGALFFGQLPVQGAHVSWGMVIVGSVVLVYAIMALLAFIRSKPAAGGAQNDDRA